MRKRKPNSPAEIAANARNFAATRAVLETPTRPEVDSGARQVASFMFAGGCDALVSKEGFFLRFTGNPGPHEYASVCAAPILGHLLHLARWAPMGGELCAVPLPPHGLKLVPFPRPEEGGRLFWLRDGGEVIRFALRVDSEELRSVAWPPAIQVPSKGTPDFTELDPARACPHCAAVLSRVRDYGTFRVCHECGRSFTSWDSSNPNP